MSDADRGAPDTELTGALDAVLADLGVQPTSVRDQVAAIVAAHLGSRGLHARVATLRHGVLTLEATTQVAALLRLDLPALLAAIDDALPGVVAEARVRTHP